MIGILFSRLCILACGTLYPGYLCFKTVRAKNVHDYVKWMMYWIVFAIFTTIEAFTDIFLSWFPFYYEFKVLILLWLLPNIGNGSSYVYKHYVHPTLKKHETRVDNQLVQAREKGTDLVVQYIKDAVLFIGRNVTDIPNVILRLLANNDLSSRPTQNLQDIAIEEMEVQQTPKAAKRQRGATKATRNKSPDDAQAPQTRGRKARQTKQEIDPDFNNS